LGDLLFVGVALSADRADVAAVASVPVEVAVGCSPDGDAEEVFGPVVVFAGAPCVRLVGGAAGTPFL
jgi:hypothetical protein